MKFKEIFMIITPIVIGVIISSFQLGRNAEAQSNNQRAALTGPLMINNTAGKHLFAIWYSSTKGTVLRLYDKNGNALVDVNGTTSVVDVGKALNVDPPSTDGP